MKNRKKEDVDYFSNEYAFFWLLSYFFTMLIFSLIVSIPVLFVTEGYFWISYRVWYFLFENSFYVFLLLFLIGVISDSGLKMRYARFLGVLLILTIFELLLFGILPRFEYVNNLWS